MYNFSDNANDFSICPECDNKFISSHKHRKYCSDKCFEEYRRKYVNQRDKNHYIKNKTCKHCGEVVKSIREDLYSGGCCKKQECIEKEKLFRIRKSKLKWYNKNKKNPVRNKKKDAEASKKYRKLRRKRINVKDSYRKKKRDWICNLKKVSKCLRCGDNRFYCLDFHHRIPSEKDFSISHAISGKYGHDRILEEIKKCIVLCKNCHSEVHYLMETSTFNLDEWLNCKGFSAKNIEYSI